MPEIDFDQLSGSARLWIYGARIPLDSEQVAALGDHLGRFLLDWRSHGREIEPSWCLFHDQFLVIGVDETAMSLSGCSIDSMFQAVEAFGRASGTTFSRGGNQVFYRDGTGQVRCVDRLAFADLARQGAVDQDTIVFDNTVDRAEALRAGRWELPLRESWHARAFGKALGSQV